MIDNYISLSTRFIPYYNEIAKTINSMIHNQIGYKNSCYQIVTQKAQTIISTAESYLYERIMYFNAKEEAWLSGVSLSGCTTLTASDPVTETTTNAETAGNKNWHVSMMKTYNDANAAVVLRVTKTSAAGRTTKKIKFGRTPTTTRTYYNTVDDFLAYQSELGYGQDFIVYSDIAQHSLSPKETFNEIVS